MAAPPPPAAPAAPADPWADPRARDYGFVGLAALVVVFVAMTLRGGPATGLLGPAVAALGLAFRWPSAGGLMLFVLTYLLVFPYGVPTAGFGDDLPGGPHFRVVDVVLVAAVVTYVGCYHRALGMTLRAVPDDPPAAPADPRLPPPVAADGGLRRVALAALAATLAGQLAWLAVAHLTVDLGRLPPVVAAPAGGRRAARAAPLTARLVLFGGLLVVAVGAAGFAAWHRRLARLTRPEARMLLLDTAWREARRELHRLESWRAWGTPGGRYVAPVTPDRQAARDRRRRAAIAAAVGLVFAAWVALRLLTAAVVEGDADSP